MGRRLQLNLILAAAAIVLSGLLWFTGTKSPATLEPLLNIAPQDIHRIEIHASSHTAAITLVKKQGDWRLVRPVTARANSNRIHALLDIATVVPTRRYAANTIDAEQTGLDQPIATIRFNNGPLLAIGAYTPLNTDQSQRYVRIGDTVALTTIPRAGLLDMTWTQWADPHLLAPGADLHALRLPGITLTRTDTGGWNVTPGNQDRGADAAQLTVDAWRHALALSITPAEEQPEKSTVTLEFANGRTRLLEVTARQPQLILRDPELGIAYHLPGELAAPLLDMRHPASALSGDAGKRRRRPAQRGRTPANRSPR